MYSIQPRLHCRIDVAARAVADHPSVGLYNFVLVHQGSICLGIFLRYNFNRLEKSLQSRSFDFCSLFGWLALGEQDESMPGG